MWAGPTARPPAIAAAQLTPAAAPWQSPRSAPAARSSPDRLRCFAAEREGCCPKVKRSGSQPVGSRETISTTTFAFSASFTASSPTKAGEPSSGDARSSAAAAAAAGFAAAAAPPPLPARRRQTAEVPPACRQACQSALGGGGVPRVLSRSLVLLAPPPPQPPVRREGREGSS